MQPTIITMLMAISTLVATLAHQNLFADESKSVNVTTAPLSAHTFYPEYSAPAETLSLNQSRISPETSGTLSSLPVLVGQAITKGDLLATLDCQNNLLHLKKAEAALLSIDARVSLAKKQIQRTQSLRKTRNVSEERLNQQEADLKTARADRLAQQARIDEAKLNITRCEIKAPFSGVVMERLAGEGEWINPGQPLITLVDSQRLEVSAEVSATAVSSLEKAKQIQFESNRGVSVVTLSRLVPVMRSRGRNQEARLLFLDDPALPGTTGRLTWKSTTPHIAADIPITRDEQLGLFIAQDGIAKFHPIPNALEGQPSAITLSDNVEIIIEGRHALNDGDKVSVTH